LVDAMKTARQVPLVIITGQGDERVAVDMMKRGATDYLIKDANFIEMLPMVVHRTLAQIENRARLKAAEAALHQQEAFHAAVMAASGAIFIVLDAQKRVVGVNEAFQKISKLALSEVQGRPLPDTVVVPCLPVDFNTTESVQCEGFLLNADGERKWIAWSVTAIRSADDQVQHVVVSGIDVTDRRRLEEEILEISEREQKRIGQDLHDDLGQQLVGAWCMAQALTKGLQAGRSKFADESARITAQLKESVALTRALARGLHPVALEAGGFGTAIHDLAERMENIFGVVCQCEYPAGLEIANGSAMHLYRIAQEAVTNAIKHGHAREISIKVSSNPHQTVLSVRNNGASIPDEAPAGTGTGMGLRIMKYRAGVIGASLDIQNNSSDVGVTITCAIPTSACSETNSPPSHGQEKHRQPA
ncbi:MAG: ATP-binding protein, partial [Prosthecobacter sp.]